MSVQLITRDLIARVLEQARKSPRRRMNHNFHATLEENLHRFLNVMLHGSYVAPHRHLNPPKPESFLVLEGRVALLTFDADGRVSARYELGGEGPVGIDVAAGIWHTLIVLTPHVVIYEVKPGPYVAATDKEFAPWAPREGDPGAPEYLNSLSALS